MDPDPNVEEDQNFGSNHNLDPFEESKDTIRVLDMRYPQTDRERDTERERGRKVEEGNRVEEGERERDK